MESISMRRLDLKEASQVSGGVSKIVIYIAQEFAKASISNYVNGLQGQEGAPSGGASYREINPDGSSLELNCSPGQSLEVNESTGSASCK